MDWLPAKMNKRDLLNKIDDAASGTHLKFFGERPGLSTFLFHSVFENKQQISSNQILPQERMTVGVFCQFLDYFLSNNYQFVTPEDIRKGLPDDKAKYGLITFDDGYFNNTLIPAILAEYKVPAIFFISTAYITEGKKFWSDVIYYERKKNHLDDSTILKEIIGLKSLKTTQVEKYLVKEFGEGCMKPLSDIDRPMTAAELSSFAKQPFVHIGNHTHQHEILTNLSAQEVGQEFITSQEILTQLINKTPWFVSYPNGSFSEMVVEIAMQNGLTMGITTIQQKNSLPLKTGKHGQVLLDRLNPVAVNGDTINYHRLQSSFQLKTQFKKWLQ
ncbi:MAG: hypothetical protein JWQ30_1884 [Sediminibacterium sp.]|nr:hypothetical protein [Sediminibacterium sp.]